MKEDFRISGTLTCDVLIIGAGGAGLRCAVEILEKRPGTTIMAVTKVGHAQKSHTSTAQGGIGAVDTGDPADKPIYHMFDTWKGSDCLADQNVIRKVVSSAWEEIIWFENHGMHFSRDVEGNLNKRTFGGHTIRFGEASAYRGVYEADRTGKGLVDTLWGEALRGGMSFINQSIATELLFNDNRCVGAVLFKEKEGVFVNILASVTVLAMGGSGQVFKFTTNCRQNTGDHLALGLQGGFPVMDPEAVQFHPTGIVGPGILASETLRSLGGILRNRDLEPFMVRYAPKMKELAPRDLVARAIETEIREGRGILNPDHQIEHVWIDLRHLSDYVHDVQLPEVTSFFKKFMNIDPKQELCPIRPSNHYHMGGIPTNECAEVEKSPGSIVPGLLAVGECAAASLHGFNRLATNSLLELITMGKVAGERALEHLGDGLTRAAADAGQKTMSRFSSFLEATGTENMGKIKDVLRTTMSSKVGVFRDEQGIAEAIETIRELQVRAGRIGLHNKSLMMNQELVERWELDNLLWSAFVIAQAALQRRESRGGHFRDDFPERKNEFNHHTLIFMEEFDRFRFGKREVNMCLCDPAACGEHERFGIIERKY